MKKKDKLICGILLIVLFSIFGGLYVFNVTSPQFGWWQYFAWRMNEGDILYKDIYLFIPPYFVFITKLLYEVFGNHLILYTLLVGYPVKLLCLVLLYLIICEYAKPIFSCISVFCGACITSTYKMDMWYDYNPLSILPCILIAYLVVLFYKKAKNGTASCPLAFFIGILLSYLLCFKHTFGISFIFTSLIIYFVIYFREYTGSTKNYLISSGFAVLGFLIGLIPLLAYLTANDCWFDFYRCLSGNVNSKGGMATILMRPFYVLAEFKIWVYLLVLFIIWRIYKCFSAQARLTESNHSDIFVWLLLLLAPIMILYAVFIPANVHADIATSSLVVDWKARLSAMLFYSGFLYWIIVSVKYFSGKTESSSILIFSSFIVAHFVSGVMSTNFIEELFMILYIPWMLAAAFQAICNCKLAKDFIIFTFTLMIIFACISIKQFMPYDWQGWRETSKENTKVKCTVPGLEGIRCSEKANITFNKIVNLVEENTDKDDKVFQFANIPLFNLLTNRQIPSYTPITWFDVCPDELAEQTAEYLEKNPPSIIVWTNISNAEWDLLEDVFRGGRISGQRKLKMYYENHITVEYTLLYRSYNNRDGYIEVWKTKGKNI